VSIRYLDSWASCEQKVHQLHTFDGLERYQTKRASRESMSPLFKNVNGFVNLSKEVVGIEITIVILSSLEYNVSFSVDTHPSLRKMI
jgi:hypothetical protein